jgi:hypothetical protein
LLTGAEGELEVAHRAWGHTRMQRVLEASLRLAEARGRLSVGGADLDRDLCTVVEHLDAMPGGVLSRRARTRALVGALAQLRVAKGRLASQLRAQGAVEGQVDPAWLEPADAGDRDRRRGSLNGRGSTTRNISAG